MSYALTLVLRRLRPIALFVALVVTGCLEKHELFQEVTGGGGLALPGGGVSGSGGSAGAGPAAGGSAGVERPRSPVGDPCVIDSDCVSGAWCGDGACTPCTPPAACRAGFAIVKRNGCDACAPPNQCTSDANCGEEMKCYAGQQCDPGCDGSPACCHGNICGEGECGPPVNLDCSVVGCADWGTCVGSARSDECECDDEQWGCDVTGGQNQCEPAR